MKKFSFVLSALATIVIAAPAVAQDKPMMHKDMHRNMSMHHHMRHEGMMMHHNRHHMMHRAMREGMESPR
jgi:hypothetical protein